MDDYYNTYKKVSDMFKEYGVTGDIRRIASEFPLRCLDEKCPYDGSRLVKRMPARSMSDRFLPKCPVCGHQPDLDDCPCSGCQEKRGQDRADKQAVIRTYYTNVMPRVKARYQWLPTAEKVYLAAMGCLMRWKGLTVVGDALRVLTPSEIFTRQIVKTFIDKRVLVVDPNSPVDAFKDEDFPKKYNLFGVNYRLNLEGFENHEDLFDDADWLAIHSDREACLEIWQKLVFYDCFEKVFPFIGAGIDQTDLDQAKEVVGELINQYPVEQAKTILNAAGIEVVMTFWKNDDKSDKEILEFFLNEIKKRMTGEVKMEWSRIALSGPAESTLSDVFRDEILPFDVDFEEAIPSLELLGN